MADVQNKMDGTRIGTLIKDLDSKRSNMIDIIKDCSGRMTTLQTVYKSDASTQYQAALNKIAEEVNNAVNAIINSLNTNATQMVKDYKAQDEKIASSTNTVTNTQ